MEAVVSLRETDCRKVVFADIGQSMTFGQKEAFIFGQPSESFDAQLEMKFG